MTIPGVTRVTVSDGVNVAAGQSNYPIRTVTFYYGQQGPFRLVYKRDLYSPATVQTDMQNIVNGLEQIGATSGG